ncbi:MAG: hypothetical protein NZ846_06935 [Thermus sp.]|uniref:hypothetical protein n=1 Tax=Thermus sp. TaxID=275 RepID=UPI0025DA5675|nr:hypothetical protein [Thermus sp.]MCS7218698.1 hypothetical protein [Thermus sp.]
MKLPDAHAFVTYVSARLGGETPEEALRQALTIRDFYFYPEATLAGWGATLDDDPEEVYLRIVSLPPIPRQTGEVDEEEAKEYYRRLLGEELEP